MRLAAYASQPNYWRHLAPIVADLRGRGIEVEAWSRDPGSPWGEPLVEHRHRETLPPLMLIASHQDAIRFRDRACVYVEHGAGQTYRTDDLEDGDRLGVGFAGGDDLDHVALFVAPSERVAAIWRARYPRAAAIAVGCPALDRYVDGRAHARSAPDQHRRDLGKPNSPGLPRSFAPDRTRTETRTVAITAHHPTFGAIPECRPALPHYDAVLPYLRIDLARAGVELVGHAHPRGAGAMIRRWENLGIRFEPDPDVVLSTAALLIADNSSILYEAAAVGVPVLVLNAPWYRRDVEHGLRFWSHVPGLACDRPSDLAWKVEHALADAPILGALRTRAARYAYSFLDGQAARRAADAILTIEGASLMAPTGGEIENTTDEVIDRVYQLGGTDDQAAGIRAADPDEIERLRRLNDVALAAEIAQNAGPTPMVAGDGEEGLDAAAEVLLDNASDDGEILAAVGSDTDLAARLFRLESARDPNSPDLLADLAQIAGIAYEAPVEATEPADAGGEPVADLVAGEDLAAGDAVEVTDG